MTICTLTIAPPLNDMGFPLAVLVRCPVCARGPWPQVPDVQPAVLPLGRGARGAEARRGDAAAHGSAPGPGVRGTLL